MEQPALAQAPVPEPQIMVEEVKPEPNEIGSEPTEIIPATNFSKRQHRWQRMKYE